MEQKQRGGEGRIYSSPGGRRGAKSGFPVELIPATVGSHRLTERSSRASPVRGCLPGRGGMQHPGQRLCLHQPLCPRAASAKSNFREEEEEEEERLVQVVRPTNPTNTVMSGRKITSLNPELINF